jgi:site-specific DNA-adenine methylase
MAMFTIVNNYPGGKNGSGTFQTIINQIPPHDLYVEAFAGSGAILRRKKPAAATIAIDDDASACEALKDVVPGLIVVNGDATRLLRSVIARSVIARSDFARSRIFIYADPPYLFSTRASKRPIYKKEFGTVPQHKRLLKLLKSLDCMVMLSGYWSDLYEKELKDWRVVSYNSVTRSGDVVREYLWMNYPEPVALHDYSFLGSNFTERQVIKRQIQRWQDRLKRMPPLKRRALEIALAENKIS